MMRVSMFRTMLVALGVAAVPAMAAPIEIVGTEFGVFDMSNPRETLFQPTNIIPHRPGLKYGWVIEVRTRQRSVSVREEYLLPSQAKPSVPGSGTLVLPLERRNQVSQRQLVPQDGRIFGEWEMGPGEPAGRRHLQVVVEGQVAAEFEYDVR